MAYSTIVKPGDYFNTKLYTGNGTTDTAITGVGFQPDLSIIKARDMAYNHNVMDAVRGSTKRVATDLTDAESTQAEMIKSFASDGFNLGDNGGVNQDTKTYASWNWLANGAGSANTDGSINSTVSANTTSGFSVVSYTGTGANATVGHGLSSAPSMIIVKNRSAVKDWVIYHKSLGNTKFLEFTTSAEQTASNRWNNTTPTNSVFSLGSDNGANGSGNSHIAYCFAEKAGYSKFGSYVGNGDANGPFIYTGFKPAFVMIKSSSDSSTWHLADNKRIGYNPLNYRIQPNNSNVEYTGVEIYSDFLSNGFKLRNTDTDTNGSGRTYIYMAFAEEPLVANSGTDGVPATAR